jgi:hypothetical protein
MRGFSAEVLSVSGAGALPGGESGGAASNITYGIVVHGPDGDEFYSNITPLFRWWPDTIDTVAPPIGTPVGIVMRGQEIDFMVPERCRIDEECEQ